MSLSLGDIVLFGIYPQTTKGENETSIERQVSDIQGSKAPLINKYTLTNMKEALVFCSLFDYHPAGSGRNV